VDLTAASEVGTASLITDLTWPEIERRTAAGSLLVVPLGATEQHGPHLPLSTDTDIAIALAQRLAEHRRDVLVAPPLGYGASGEHAGFAGTLSIGHEALTLVILELVRSASDTFAAVLLISAHGGNAVPVDAAVRRLRLEGHDVRGFSPRWEGDPHAGGAETAMMLALSPGRVRMEHAAPGDMRPIAETLPLMRSGGVRSVSPTGVLGDPTGADAAAGEALLDALASTLLEQVDNWWPRVSA
jgi:creatinine amidohydrolase